MPFCGMLNFPGILMNMNAYEFEIVYIQENLYEFNTKFKDPDATLVYKYQNTPTLACLHQCVQVSQMGYKAVLN